MKHRAAFLAIFSLLASAGGGQVSGSAQSATNRSGPDSLRFEVASVKLLPQRTGGGRAGPSPGGERYLATNTTLYGLIIQAYRVRFDGVTGGPGWARQELYDVQAKAERRSSGEELRAMLRNLLADRFKLQVHHDAKQLPVYRLVVDRNGPKLRPSAAENSGHPAIEEVWEELVHHVAWAAASVTMQYFAWRISPFLDRPVVDETGLTGEYDFDLKFVEDLDPELAERLAARGRPIDRHPSIFEALQEQLGLRLESGKGPVDFIVIDHAEKPSAN